MLLFATYEWLNPEFASIIISIVTAISGSFLYIWRKIIKPLFRIFKSNEKILEKLVVWQNYEQIISLESFRTTSVWIKHAQG